MSVYDEQIDVSCNDGYCYTGSNWWNVTGNTIIVGPTYPAFFRFINVPMNQGSTIDSAYIKVWTDEYGSSNSVTLKVRATTEDDAAVFTCTNGTNTDPVNRSRTSAGIDFDFDGTRNVLRTSGDIKTVIQEIVDRSGWDGGNAMCIVLEPDGGTFGNDLVSYDGISAKAAELIINYTGTSNYSQTCFSVARIVNPERDVGIKIMKPTYDVDDTPDDPTEQIYNSDYDTLKYFASGSATVYMTAGDVAGSQSYTHSLGYLPYAEVYAKLDDDSSWFPCPFYGFGATVFYGSTYKVTTTEIVFYAESTGFSGDHQFHFRYFLFRNDLDLPT